MAHDNPDPFPIFADAGAVRKWAREHARRAGLPPARRRVYVELCALESSRETGESNPGLDYLADQIDAPRSTVCRALIDLEGAGLIERVRVKGGRNVRTWYRILAFFEAAKLSRSVTVRPETVALRHSFEKLSRHAPKTVASRHTRD